MIVAPLLIKGEPVGTLVAVRLQGVDPGGSVGGEGIVSVVGNLFPEPLVVIVDAYWKDDPARALARHRQIYAVCKAMFLETNPGPVKCALWLEGKIQNELRLPMMPVKNGTRDAINSTIRMYKHELTAAHV
jgi:4-hydroxy-tetrahydrodipicolinate synthase